MKLLVLIPAKLDSKRLKNKNIQLINGKTLVEHSIDYAKKNKISYIVLEPNKRSIVKKSYADNFLK